MCDIFSKPPCISPPIMSRFGPLVSELRENIVYWVHFPLGLLADISLIGGHYPTVEQLLTILRRRLNL